MSIITHFPTSGNLPAIAIIPKRPIKMTVPKNHVFPSAENTGNIWNDPSGLHFTPEFDRDFIYKCNELHEVLAPYYDGIVTCISNIIGTAICIIAVAILVYGTILLLMWLSSKIHELINYSRNK